MGSALEAFQAQEDLAERLHTEVLEIGAAMQRLRSEMDVLGRHDVLRRTLNEEQVWLRQAERAVAEVRVWREQDLREYWPGVWRRWAAAVCLALMSCAAAGAGYVWALRPYETELASLRERTEVMDRIAARLLEMTPAERRQFDALMKSDLAGRQ
jgi:hypothetical protein